MTQLDVASGFEGGLAVVLLAVYLDRVTGALAGRRRRVPAGPAAGAVLDGAAQPPVTDEPVVATSATDR